MLKKIEKAYLQLENNVQFLRCPICHAPFQLERYALRCEHQHTYNLNKKGFVNFLQTKADMEHYTRKMFEPRRRLIQAGMYAPVLAEIQNHLVIGNLLDVGTGEGSFLEKISVSGSKFAFDISKDGIEMATELETGSFLSLADLTNLPFADGSLSVILNIFTPSNYAEFRRVLSQGGRVIKVVPDHFYLQELRQSYGIALDYKNEAVIERFRREFPDMTQIEVKQSFKLPEQLRTDFLAMSPLEWSVSERIKKKARENPPQEATIHVQILIGEKEKKLT